MNAINVPAEKGLTSGMPSSPESVQLTDSDRARGAATTTPTLAMRGITKKFFGVTVLDEVDFELPPATTVGLVGENGAGKSTLMKIVAGIHPSGTYAGVLEVDGQPVQLAHTNDALENGIVYVAQELMFSPHLSLAENMFAGRLPRRFGMVVDRKRLAARAAEALADFAIDADPGREAGSYSPATQRLAAIAAALSESSRVLILDEPTASLTEPESDRLFERVAALHKRGVSCIHITHRLDEIDNYAHRVVVLRNGKVSARIGEAKGKRRDIVRAMLGQENLEAVESARDRAEPVVGEPVLAVNDLRLWESTRQRAKPRVDGVSFELREGEILGVFGLVGAGRTEMARAIFGAWPGEIDGDVTMRNETLRFGSPRDAIAHGITMLPEDRKVNGIIAGQSVTANMSASSVGGVAKGGLIDQKRETARNGDYLKDLDVRPARLNVNIETLSGGNQQKVLLARCLAAEPRVLILDEPTAGVDLGARLEIYRIIRELTATGLSVLLISSDISEVLTESDRILVMYKGKVSAEFGPDATRVDLMAAATGGADQ